jgi:hypothetical protein
MEKSRKNFTSLDIKSKRNVTFLGIYPDAMPL